MARISLISLLFIILPIAVYSEQLPSSNPVLDDSGPGRHPVQTGVDYEIEILPFLTLRLSPLSIGLSSNHTCPPDVIIKERGTKALPVKFSSPVDSKDNQTVNTFIDTNIAFSASTVCGTSTVWTMQPGTVNGTITYFLEIGGVKENPESWFNIQPGKPIANQRGYEINFCPRVCSGCERPAACGNIGAIVDDEGRTRLGVTSDEGLQVVFSKPFIKH